MVMLPSETIPVGSRQARTIRNRHGMRMGWMARMAPVSYTHLDVYKRQTLTRRAV